jgi:glycosyltransferase involved in cell wall biosynthesis
MSPRPADSTASPASPRLVLITTVPMTFGFFRGQIGFLKGKGFDIRGVSSPAALLDEVAAREHIPCTGIEMPRSISPLRDVIALARLTRLLVRIGATIVHAHTPKGGLLGMLAARLARVPVRVYHVHGMPYMTARGWRRVLLRWTERLACAQAHQVLCVSDSIRRIAVSDRICRGDRIKVLAGGSINGVDALERFAPERHRQARHAIRCRTGIPRDALVIGFVGRLVRDKGVVELAAAWQRLRDELPLLHLLVVGPFESRDAVPPPVAHLLRTDPRVHLAGEVGDTAPWYAAMDVICLPTYREGLPVVPLEAAAMGLPVVATRIPGCIEAIEDGVTGTLIPPCDPAALVVALRGYLTDAARRRAHGAAGRRRALDRFAPQSLWAAQLEEYRRLLAARAPSSVPAREAACF